MAAVDIRPERLMRLFQTMVDVYSPSGREEELTEVLAEWLAECGLPVQRQAVDGSRENLIVTTGAEPELLFLGHIDTVPAFDIERYRMQVEGDRCRGLGTADMKGGCAALIEAFTAAAEAGTLSENCVLALVVGEEETGDGTRALLETRHCREALVAEPTGLRPALSHYGYVELSVRTFGCRRHAALSSREMNAVHALLRFLLRLEDRIQTTEPGTVMNIRDLHSSESGFATADRCMAGVDFHIPPDWSAGVYAARLERFVEEVLGESCASRYEATFPTLADGYAVVPDSALPQRLNRLYAEQQRIWDPAPFKSHSDANLLQEAGCAPIVLGPGRLEQAHTADESVLFSEVESAARIYAGLLGHS